ncbi:MAG: Ppx/GppA family phosphatase [Bacteroidales bacterium]|nr:Ppx/GppA family phosphatase [Bacteroidales bacterium]
MKILKFAAIDIGTNAMRLLFTNIIENGEATTFKKSSIIRVPIRLGADVFTTGKIGDTRKQKMLDAMIAFKHLMKVHDVLRYRACATSAMREARNGKEMVDLIKKKADIRIDIIDGKTEAEIIYHNRVVDMLENDVPYLYVDIGGGSTEITLFYDKTVQASHSFNIGTIRLLNLQVPEQTFNELKTTLKQIRKSYPGLQIIGSGGNINKLLKLSRKKEGKPLATEVLKKVYNEIKHYSYEDRIKILGLNPDRADVIIPASDLLFKIVKWSGAREIIVPKVGIADGMIRQIYDDYQKGKN